MRDRSISLSTRSMGGEYTRPGHGRESGGLVSLDANAGLGPAVGEV